MLDKSNSLRYVLGMKADRTHSRDSGSNEIAAINSSILIALRRIIRAVAMHSRRLMEEHGLTGPQLAALQQLLEGGTLSARDLARTLHLSQPTITGILDRLEQRQLITRQRSGTDRRALDIAITEAGQHVLKAAPPLLQQRFAEELSKLQSWEQTMILATLQRVATMMDAGELPAAPFLVTNPEKL